MSLLEEAIIDAKIIKDLALKNAQEAIIEKFAPEVEKTLNKLLNEQTEEDDDEEKIESKPSLGTSKIETEPINQTAKDLPLSATEGEKLCPCPDEDQEIEINFDELEKQMKSAEKKGEDLTPTLEPELTPVDLSLNEMKYGDDEKDDERMLAIIAEEEVREMVEEELKSLNQEDESDLVEKNEKVNPWAACRDSVRIGKIRKI